MGMSYSYDHRTARKAPKLPRGKWEVGGKTVANEKAAIQAAVQQSMSGGGKTVKIYEQRDAVGGVEGTRGYSVTVKSISRKAPRR